MHLIIQTKRNLDFSKIISTFATQETRKDKEK